MITLTPNNMFERMDIYLSLYGAQEYHDIVDVLCAMFNTNMYVPIGQFVMRTMDPVWIGCGQMHA